MAYRLGGRNSLPYLGVEAPTPANTVFNKRSPTSTDSQNFNIGTWWLRTNAQNAADELWLLISLVGGVATWVQLYPSNAGGASQFDTDNGTANELAGVINILGGADPSGFTNLNTKGFGNTVEVILNETIQWSNTTSGLGAGAIFLGGNSFMHNFGALSTFLGSNAGPTTNSSSGNTGIGTTSLNAITALGQNNTSLGSGSGFALTDGSTNLLLGFAAGSNYTVEDDNITLANLGTIGDTGVIRIGSVLQTDCYVAGIYNANIGTTNAPVFIDNNGKLGTLEAGISLDGSSFLAYVNPNEVLPISGAFDQQNYVGALQAMNLAYDNFGSFNVGPIVGGAQFIAVIKGYYQFTFTVNMSFSASLTSNWFAVIYLNGTGVAVNTKTSTPTLTFNAQSTGTLIVNANLLLDIGDVITCGTITNNSSGTAPQYLGLLTIGPLSLNCYQTWIMGTLLKTAP